MAGRQKDPKNKVPAPGDSIFFYYGKTKGPSKGTDPGFYGWAVVLEWRNDSHNQLHFRPTAPSDFLKMHPWSDKKALGLADGIRGKVKQGTLWLVPNSTAKAQARNYPVVTRLLNKRNGDS